MKKLTVLIGLSLLLYGTAVQAQVSEEELQALRDQIQMLTKRLDQLEQQNAQSQTQVAPAPAPVDQDTTAKVEELDQEVETLNEQVAAMSWAERIRWEGDFRYRYENIDEEGKDGRNRSRIRARTHLEADLSPTLQVGIGLATGGDDPVSSNQTIGGGGSSKDIKLDLAYFDWTGITDTNIIGGKFKNFLVRPAKKGLMWDGDWRPEGLGIVWDNDFLFAQGLGTWLEGDSRNGTEFAWVAQGGMNLAIGETGKLKFGGGYSAFDIAGGTPLFGDPDDFRYLVDRCHEKGIGVPVISTSELDEHGASRGGPSEADCTHGGLRTGVHEADHLNGGHKFNHQLGQVDLSGGGGSK